MARFDLDQIENFMDDTPAINVALPTGGAYLLQCALSTMDKRWQWIDDGDPLTDEQWDELQTDLAALMLALITEVESMGVPIGMILPYASTLAPDGFLLCDGDGYLRVDYPLLYAVLPPLWIVDADNFLTPNLTDKFTRGCSQPFCAPGEEGGADTVSLSVLQLPIHSHQLMLKSATGSGSNYAEESGEGSIDGVGNTATTGLGLAHDNIPAYMAFPYYIRAL